MVRFAARSWPPGLDFARSGDRLGSVFDRFWVVFDVDLAFRRKTLDPYETLAGAIESDVQASPERPKNVRISLREHLANNCPNRTLKKVDSGPPGRTFRSLRGLLGASGGVPRCSGGVPRALRASPGVSRERSRSPPHRPRLPRGPPGAFWVDC